MEKVYIKKVSNLKEDVRELLELLKWRKIIQNSDKVIIKPNFCTHALKNGVTTNLELLNNLVSIVRERTNEVFIGETYSANKDFARLAENLSSKIECDFMNLSKLETYHFKSSFGTINLPTIALESKIINVPVLKTHGLTCVTIGMKNLFGLAQDKDKAKYHYYIEKILVELLEVLKPEINILDAICSMDGSGPTSGNIHKTNFLMASNNVIALDAAACEVIKLNPQKVAHIREAVKRYKIEYVMSGKFECNFNFNIPYPTWIEKIGAFLQSHSTADILRKFI